MAQIDRRVRLLTDALMDRGFGWLSTEIVEAIERGRESHDRRDDNVSGHRESLKSSIANDSPHRTTFEKIDYSIIATETLAEPLAPDRYFLPDEQVIIAVNLLIDRIFDATKMASQALYLLQNIVGAPIHFYVEVDGEPRSINTDVAVQTATELHQTRQAFTEWLMTQSSDESPE